MSKELVQLAPVQLARTGSTEPPRFPPQAQVQLARVQLARVQLARVGSIEPLVRSISPAPEPLFGAPDDPGRATASSLPCASGATELFPFAIALVIPPAGLLIGLLQLTQEDRALGVRIVVVALLAAVVWTLLLTR